MNEVMSGWVESTELKWVKVLSSGVENNEQMREKSWSYFTWEPVLSSWVGNTGQMSGKSTERMSCRIYWANEWSYWAVEWNVLSGSVESTERMSRKYWEDEWKKYWADELWNVLREWVKVLSGWVECTERMSGKFRADEWNSWEDEWNVLSGWQRIIVNVLSSWVETNEWASAK
jgi:hypothetical protein